MSLKVSVYGLRGTNGKKGRSEKASPPLSLCAHPQPDRLLFPPRNPTRTRCAFYVSPFLRKQRRLCLVSSADMNTTKLKPDGALGVFVRALSG